MADIKERIEQLKRQIKETDDERERLALTLKLGAYYSNVGSSRASICARRVYQLARSLDDNLMVARALILQGTIRMNQADYAKAWRVMLRSWKLLKGLPECFIEKIRVCRMLGQICLQHRSELSKAMRWYQRGEEFARAAGNHPARAQLFYYMAVIFHERGMLEREAQLLGRALQILRKHPDDSLLARSVEAHSCSLLGVLHGEFDQWDTARSYLSQSLSLFRDIDFTYGVANSHHDIGYVLFLKGRKLVDDMVLEEALGELCIAYRMFGELENSQMQGLVLMKMGAVYKVQGEPAKALQYIERALECIEEKVNPVAWVTIQIENALVLIVLERWADALAVLEPLVPSDGETAPAALHDALAQAYEGAGNMERALFHYRKWVEKDHSIIRTAIERRLMTIQEQAREYEEGVAGEVDERAQQQSGEMKEQKKFAEELHERSKVLEDLRSRLSLMKERREVIPGTVQKLLLEIDNRAQKVEAWESFAEQIYAMNREVLPSLEQKYPSLTPTEIRVCLLLRINLSNKEIAGLLNITERTVDTHRTRIRRKMGLERKDDLVSRLLALGTH